MTHPADAPAADARALATELKRRWRRGEAAADAAAALADHPALARHKSVVIDLAYEEYLLREKTGDAPDPAAFAGRFPAFRASIRNMLDDHRLLTERPELLAPAAGDWPEVGSTFEELELLALLGRGAFAHAYLAHDPTTARLCVLKLSAGRSAEARVMGQLRHPHVADVFWTRTVGGRTAVCMRFVGISTLADVVSAAFPGPAAPPPAAAGAILRAAETDVLAERAERAEPAGHAEPVVRADEPYLVGACAVAARVADAVAYLHRAGVAHGDLKPSNVVVGPGGAPYLIDFNLSSREDALPAVRGTPAYMAPELLDAAVAGSPAGPIDLARADLFSLAVVVTELLTGRHPYAPDGPATLADLAAAARRAAPALPAALPRALAAVLTACLAADPARRPASAAGVSAAFGRFVTGRRTPWWRKRRTLVAAAALALFGVGAAVALLIPPPPAPNVQQERPPETADEFHAHGREYLRNGNVPAARADFFIAHERGKKARDMAFVAYCFALENQPQASIGAGERAIKDGAATAEVYNNVGFAYAQTNRPGAAVEPLDEALALTPGLPAALYNRALARFGAGLGAKIDVDPRAADDITAALKAGLRSADVHFDAAHIYAACSVGRPDLRAKAIEQVKAAIAAGKDPVQCESDALLKTFLDGDPAFAAACRTPRGQPVAPPRPDHLRLLEPRF